jgi:hypothetical protein
VSTKPGSGGVDRDLGPDPGRCRRVADRPLSKGLSVFLMLFLSLALWAALWGALALLAWNGCTDLFTALCQTPR